MGPLHGLKIVEVVGLGPGPFGAMLLADMGAEVIRIDRPGGGMFSGSGNNPRLDFLNRNKRSVCIDLKNPQGLQTALRLIEQADGLIEGNRPGVMEKLGLGPDECLQRNPRLVYGRMTGWGQQGPWANLVGHDINYIALTGALHATGRAGQKPAIPLNLVGDFGGGGLMLAFGMVCALLEARSSGQGQVVDAAMIDGASTLMTTIFGAFQAGFWSDNRGENMLDSGSHFYEVYETKDGKYISLGSIEPQFYAALLEKLGDEAEPFANQFDMENWPAMKEKLQAIISRKTRDEWDEVFVGSDVCYAPVLSMEEARHHPHNAARDTFVEFNDAWQPAPAPRFSRSKAELRLPPVNGGEHSEALLAEHGFTESEIAQLLEAGAVHTS